MSANIIPTENDILMGRGARTREHTGNKRFQSIVREYRESYAATRTYKEKDAVANEVLARLREGDPPGRFLTDDNSSKETRNGDDSAEGVVWSEVVDKKKIMEKIKQALREPDNKSAIRRAAILEEAKRAERVAAAGMGLSNPPPALPTSAPFFGHLLPFYNATDPNTALHGLPAQQQHLFPSFLPGRYGVASLFGLVPVDRPVESTGSLQGDRPEVTETTMQNMPVCTDDVILKGTDDNIRKKKSCESDNFLTGTSSTGASSTSTFSTDTTEVDLDPDDILAAQLLSSSLSEKARQARVELEHDKQKVTEEEKDQALVDLFGSLCEIDQSKKRVKRAPVEIQVSVLLKQMKWELDVIPSREKQALLEAQVTALPNEFSDGRLELFLRVEDMNPRRAAQRFVTYWNERRNLFGPDKFCLPMTLNGALRDDHVCLERGPLYLVPALDASGRVVGGCIFNRTRSDEYDTQSILRCWWFFIDVASKHPNAKKPFFARVAINHFAGASLFGIDLEALRRITEFKEKVSPLSDRIVHSCNMSDSLSAIVKPLALLAVKRDTRLRKVFHDCREEETAASLQEYGIPGHILPKEMGGQCDDFDAERKKWVAQLRKLDTPQALESDEFVWWEL